MIVQSLELSDTHPPGTWPFTIPPIRQLSREGLVFHRPVTFIVGENGTGKSTLIEAIAEAYGLDVRGGHGGRKYGPATRMTGELAKHLRLHLTPEGYRTKAKRAQGFFLRSETAMGVFEYMSDHGVLGYGEIPLQEVSHGEGYIQVLLGRFKNQGLYLLDEPESPLSLHAQLVLMQRFQEVVQNGSQIICATHSPVITALPEADILEFGDNGFGRKPWSELTMVQHWRRYLDNPSCYLDN